MNYYVSSIFNRTYEIRCGKGVVDNKRNLVIVSYFCKSLYIHDFSIGVSECLYIESLGVWLEGIIHFVFVIGIHESRCNAVFGKRMLQKIVSSSVDVLCSYDVITVFGDCLDCVCYSCRTRTNSKGSHASFKGCYSFFKYILGRIGKSAVNISRILQRETVFSVLAVLEYK